MFVNSKYELHTSPCILYAFTTTQMEKKEIKRQVVVTYGII